MSNNNKWKKTYNGPFSSKESKDLMKEIERVLGLLGYEVKRTKRPNKQKWDVRVREITK